MPSARLRLVTVVKPVQLDAVVESLEPFAVRDVLVEQVRGYGRQKGHLGDYEELHEGFLPKVRVECVVDEARAGDVVDAIRRAARTGRIGDGKVFVHEVVA